MMKQPIVDTSQDPAFNPPKSITKTNLPKPLPRYHWVADPFDNRDFVYQLSSIPSMPSKVDLRPYASPIDDQGNLGSCTGNAIAGAIDLIDKKNQNRLLRVSRLFIYYQERLLEGTISQDRGAYIRDGIKACYTVGAPLESTWPYDITKFSRTPSSVAYADAAKRKVVSYAKCEDFNAVKNALAAGTPVVVGFQVYSSFESVAVARTGIMPYPNVAKEQLLGGHAVCLVGYDDAHNWFIARNSWGPNWGDHGYFYMPYQVIRDTNMSSDFWTINLVSNP